MSGVLARILASKEQEVAALRAAGPPRVTHRPRAALVQRLRRGQGEPLRLITEVKRKSPSAGALSTVLSPAARALCYAEGGATMVSVLCDGPFFDGSWDHVTEVRAALQSAGHAVAVLAKEFVIDAVQIACAAARGADAVLLIARILTPERLAELTAEARARGLEPLVEVVTPEELDIALETGAALVGVNARDLDTLVMDRERTARVLAGIPAHCTAVHLSGLKVAADVQVVAATRADAALVGEALMRDDDPRPRLSAMARAAQT